MSTRNARHLAGLALVGGLAAGPALAQPAPTPPAGAPPPTLVGRLAFLQGTVSFRAAGAAEWQSATLNYPVTSGESFWTQPGALGEIEEASSQVWMNAATELDVTTLDTQTFGVTEPQGEAFFHLAALQGQTVTIETPRGVVTITATGDYDVIAGNTEQATEISVVSGSAQVTLNTTAITVAANQTATITGTQTFQASVGALQRTAFMTQIAAREQKVVAAVQASAPPPVVTEMTGGEELSEYGAWQPSPQYGEVWYPQVPQGWAPYEDGRWVYEAPWGWTWVSAEPWGFAPFHYGRWADIGGRWGWTPGGYEEGAPPQPPVYAPALVAFFGLGEGAGRQVGWVPLAPGQAYYPPYRHDEGYLRAINRWNVPNPAALPGPPAGLAQFPNRGAAVAVPAAVMAGSQPVRGAAQRLAAGRLGQAQPMIGRHPLQPTPATAGHPAPGPQVAAGPVHPGPGGHTLPGLRQAAGAPGAPAGPAEHGREHEPGAPAAGALPALRGPNARPGAPGAAPGQPAHAGPEAPAGRAALPGLRAPGAHPGEVGTPAGPAHAGRPAAHAGPAEGHAAAPAPGHVGAPERHGGPAPEHAGAPAPHAAPAPGHAGGPAPRAEPAREHPAGPTPHRGHAPERAGGPAPYGGPAPGHPGGPAPHGGPPAGHPGGPAPHGAPPPGRAQGPAPHGGPPPGHAQGPAPHGGPPPGHAQGPAPHGGPPPGHAGGPAPHAGPHRPG